MKVPVYQTLTEILEKAVRDYPERPALLCGSSRISYRELGCRIAGLAQILQARGLEPRERVAIVLPKSIEAVVAMFATLYAGGVYVPIDRFQPLPRTGEILRDCACSDIITDRAFVENEESKKLLNMPRSALVIDDVESLEGVDAPRAPRSPDDLAFILYTSGSTGRPKGVTISHRNLLTFINWCLQEFDLRPDDVFSSHANFTFDLSTFDLYATMAAGACVKIFTEDDRKDPYRLAEAIETERISIWYSVPSALRLMTVTKAFEKYDCSSLRYVLFAGEVFPIEYLRMLRESLPNVALYNLYGPTETNVCTYCKVSNLPDDRTVPVPIGRLLPGIQAMIVDEQGNTVKPGKIGELVIKGPCVTPGYWNSTGGRNAANHRRGIHATGDRVNLKDGDLIFHGRIDDMVKVAGYRVELGELENALGQHPSIESVAVVATEADGQTVLNVCYTANAPVSLLALKSHSAKLVPAYMIPHRARHFHSLPTNRNGKIDRKALAQILQEDRPNKALDTVRH